MKIKKLFCLLTTVILIIGAFSNIMSTSAYYNGKTDYRKADKTKIGSFTYILKENAEYGSVKIPYSATVTDIPNITKVEIPEKVTYNGIEFIITDVDLDGVKPIYPAFPYKYTNIKEIKLPETIYNITEFCAFPSLKKINLPKNTIIGRECVHSNNLNPNIWLDNLIYTDDDFYDTDHISYFTECPKLKLSVDPNNPYYSYKNDFLLSKDGKQLYLSLNNSSKLTIPNGVEYLDFVGGNSSYKIKQISLPNSLKTINYGVFMISTNLSKIIFPNSVTTINQEAFFRSGIKKAKFGKGLTYIGPEAFRKCVNLKDLHLPKKLKKIDYCAFKGCKKLEKVKILSTNTKISFQVFSRCSNLKSVTINGVKEIGNGAFYKCKKLSKVKIGNKKKAPKIEKNAFKGTKKGIKFCVKNKKVAKSLKKQLKGSGVRNAKILVGKKVIYKNVK